MKANLVCENIQQIQAVSYSLQSAYKVTRQERQARLERSGSDGGMVRPEVWPRDYKAELQFHCDARVLRAGSLLAVRGYICS
jgi:hypothetical protein